MVSHKRWWRTNLSGKLLITAILIFMVVLLVTHNQGRGATFAAFNRCPSTTTQSSVAYHCWVAYPEAFYVTGVTVSSYRLAWKIACGGRSISGARSVGGIVHVVVNQFTQPAAYRLMISSDVCKIDVVAIRIAGSGSIAL